MHRMRPYRRPTGETEKPQRQHPAADRRLRREAPCRGRRGVVLLVVSSLLMASLSVAGAAGATMGPAASPEPVKGPAVGPYRPTTHPDTSDLRRGGAPVLSRGTARLVADLDAGTVTTEAFARYALAKLGHGQELPRMYADAHLPAEDAKALTFSLRPVLTSLSEQQRQQITRDVASYITGRAVPERRDFEPVAGCGGRWRYRLAGFFYECRIVGEHFVVYYNTGKNATVDLTDESPRNGVPDEAETILKSTEEAWNTYVITLGYRRPEGKTHVFTRSPLLLPGKSGIALPEVPLSWFQVLPPSIHLAEDNATSDHDDRRYLARHEVFHIVQYRYIPVPVFTISPIRTDLAAVVAAVFWNIRGINWWMEATAEWGAHQAMFNYSVPPPASTQYARHLGSLFATPEEEITFSDGLAGARQYGTFLLAEWLEERYGPEFIRRSWENVADDVNNFIDSYSDLEDTFSDYGESIAAELIEFWVSAYQLCDDEEPSWLDTSVHIADDDTWTWCNSYLEKLPADPISPLPRPAHRSLALAPSAAESVDVKGGGAGFVELVRPLPNATYEVDVTIVASGDDDMDIEARLLHWAESPNDRCSTDVVLASAGEAVTRRITVSPTCPNVTVLAGNRNYGDDTAVKISVLVKATVVPGVASDRVLIVGSDPYASAARSDLWSALYEAGYTMTAAEVLPADLSPYGQVWWVDLKPIPSDQATRLVDFVKTGRGLYLTGERPCCETLNDSAEAVVNALLNVGPIQVGGLGDAAYCTCPLPVNQDVIGGLATTPNAVSQWQPSAPGAIGNVASRNVLTYANDRVTGAAWAADDVVGGGRVVVLMDINWLQQGFRSASWTGLAENIALFLSGLPTPPGRWLGA